MPADGRDATVDRIVDGDTIVVSLAGAKERVRLIGVDTPETVDPHRPKGCYGKEASAFTKSLLPHGTGVRLVLDAEDRDRYHRLLAYVYRTPDGVFVNAELARGGYAKELRIAPNTSHAGELRTLVESARRDHRGLWGACTDAG